MRFASPRGEEEPRFRKIRARLKGQAPIWVPDTDPCATEAREDPAPACRLVFPRLPAPR